MQFVNIPSERIPILIGSGGKTKRELEKLTKTKITLDDSSVSIEGDPIKEWIAKDIVKAIGRGFSPEKALMLLADDTILEIIQLADICGNSQKSITRLKGRVIGEQGKSRRVIEEITDTYVSVYGRTIAIIGSFDEVFSAKDAIVKLLQGSRHSNVYRFLERSKKGKIQ